MYLSDKATLSQLSYSNAGLTNSLIMNHKLEPYRTMTGLGGQHNACYII